MVDEAPALGRRHATTVAVIGDIMADHYVYGSIVGTAPEGTPCVPVLVIQGDEWVLGGAGNVAGSILKLGGACRLVGVVGTDAHAERVVQIAAEIGSLTSDIVASEMMPTTVKTRYIADGSVVFRADIEKPMLSLEHVGAELRRRAVASVDEADAIILSDYRKGVVSTTLAEAVIERARKKGTPVIVDSKSKTLDGYRGAMVLVPNEREAANASGICTNGLDGATHAGRVLLERTNADAVVVKRGERGVVVVQRHATEPVVIAAPRVRVNTVIGAGDVFAGALALGMGRGMDVVSSSRVATWVASHSLWSTGTACVALGDVGRYGRAE